MTLIDELTALDQAAFDLWIADILDFDTDTCRELLAEIEADETSRERLFDRIDSGSRENRMRMLRLAAKSDPLFAVLASGMESTNPEPTLVVDHRGRVVRAAIENGRRLVDALRAGIQSTSDDVTRLLFGAASSEQVRLVSGHLSSPVVAANPGVSIAHDDGDDALLDFDEIAAATVRITNCHVVSKELHVDVEMRATAATIELLASECIAIHVRASSVMTDESATHLMLVGVLQQSGDGLVSHMTCPLTQPLKRKRLPVESFTWSIVDMEE